MRRAGLGLLLLVLVLALVPAPWLGAEGPESVFVTNFPDLQQIGGSVAVPKPIPHTRFESIEGLVSPGPLTEPSSYSEVGRLDSSGFATVTLGLTGDVQGQLVGSAPVGALLLPDVPEIVSNFRTHGIAQLELRVEVAVSPSHTGVFQSEPVSLALGFPRYRVFLYNGTTRTSEVTLYAYLKNG
jgi:hypothetical protein